MRIFAPGIHEGGFASLDAMVALLLLCLAWASIVPATAGVIRKTSRRIEIQRMLYEETNAREGRSWYFPSPDGE